MDSRPLSKVLYVRMDEELHAAILRKANANGRKASEEARRILAASLTQSHTIGGSSK